MKKVELQVTVTVPDGTDENDVAVTPLDHAEGIQDTLGDILAVLEDIIGELRNAMEARD